MKKILLISLLFAYQWAWSQADFNISIPARSNAWPGNEQAKSVFHSRAMSTWNHPKQKIELYFYITKACTLPVSIDIKTESNSEIKINLAGKTFKKAISPATNIIELGNISYKKAGYYKMTITGKSRTGSSYGDIRQVLFKGDKDLVRFIDSANSYFGRRGPSVHLGYTIPQGVNETEWYYSEIEVPKGNDIIGSYYMANGFGEGYFGMQANSATERRVLFSVWSPFHTDNPNEIPDDQKIVLLKKGDKVRTGEFGNEGSGGQSYMIFDWKAGKRYGFLLRGKPSGNNTSTYTAWFYDPEAKEWMLIASFRRPQTNTYLKRFHSFLENFVPDQGDKTRTANYCNQWVADSQGNWYPITEATFTNDATAQAQRRFDYAGGANKKGFFLKMGGFFDKNTIYRSKFNFAGKKTKPEIDLSQFQ